MSFESAGYPLQPVLPELVVNRREIRRCSLQWRRRPLVSCSEQLTLDPVVIPFFCSAAIGDRRLLPVADSR